MINATVPDNEKITASYDAIHLCGDENGAN